MGWFSKRDKSEAEQSLEALRQGAAQHQVAPPEEQDGEPFEPGVWLQLTAAPERRTPGSPLSVLNESDPVRVGTPVQLCSFGRGQETIIVSITRDGVPVDVLEQDERGEVVLGDDVDLSEIYQAAIVQGAGEEVSYDGVFALQVRTIEQRGKDVFVTGPTMGTPTKGERAILNPTIGDDDVRFARIKEVEAQPDGTALGLLLGKLDPSSLEIGDEVIHSM